ncbi:hypothetical protein AABD38_13710, partial [Staphylococcus nepalensis]
SHHLFSGLASTEKYSHFVPIFSACWGNSPNPPCDFFVEKIANTGEYLLNHYAQKCERIK